MSNIFIHGDPNPKHKESIIDFYNYLKEGSEMRFILSIGKMYEIMERTEFLFMRIEFNSKNHLEIQ